MTPGHSFLSGTAHQPVQGTIASGREQGSDSNCTGRHWENELAEVLVTSALPAWTACQPSWAISVPYYYGNPVCLCPRGLGQLPAASEHHFRVLLTDWPPPKYPRCLGFNGLDKYVMSSCLCSGH